MRLSTFSSKVPNTGHIGLLLSMCALFCCAVEVGTSLYFGTVSQVESRRRVEYREALELRPGDHGAKTVLLAGNSLLLRGVDVSQLQRATLPDLQIRRFVIENTFYLDWYYGLRRLFKQGSHPNFVALVLSPFQLASDSMNGDYSVHLLVDGGDLPEVAKVTGADRNRISSLMLSHYSEFYGTRSEIRSWILGRMVGDVSDLFRPSETVLKTREFPEGIVAERLLQLQQLCAAQGVGLILVLPPAKRDYGVSAVVQLSARDNIKMLLPVAPGALASSDFSDNVHLNNRGAEKFTPALAAGLKVIVAQAGSEPVALERISAARHNLKAVNGLEP